MSYLAFADANVAAATLSNIVIYKQQIVLAAGAAVPVEYLLLTTDSQLGSFVPQEMFLHIDDNSGIDTLTTTFSIGHTAALRSNWSTSSTYGSATVSLQLRQYKFFSPLPVWGGGTAVDAATPINAATPVYLRMTAAPASNITATFFVIGYYSGMRP